MSLSKIIKSLFKPTWQTLPGHETELVFTSVGIDYYKFVNEFNIPYGRAMAALDIQRELEEKTDAKYHKVAYESIIEFLNKGNLVAAGQVANNSLERMNNICNVDLMYKLASVLYFDKTEDVYSYDYVYADKKIRNWRKNNDVEAFFLRTPLANYLPSFDGLAMNIVEYTVGQRSLLLQTLKSRLHQLSENPKNKELILTLKSQVRELEELLTSS